MLLFRRTKTPDFDELIRPHLDALYRVAYRFRGNGPDAEDLVQDVLLKLYPRVEELIAVDNLRSWLIKVLYRHFIDQYRQGLRQADIPLSSVGQELNSLTFFDLFAHPADGPEACAESARLQQLIQKALLQLPPEQRMLIVMHDMEGTSQQDIAQIMDIPVGTVKSRLHRVRATLKQIVQKKLEPFPAH